MTAFLLLFLGLFLVFLEFYLPGAILGILGGCFIVASVIYFALDYPSPIAVTAFVLAAGLLLAAVVKFALWRIRNSKSRFSIYSDDAQNGFVASHYDKTLIGKKGKVLTDLKPGGYIIVDGKQQQALSREGYVTKGSEVEVIGGQEESLIVKKVEGNS